MELLEPRYVWNSWILWFTPRNPEEYASNEGEKHGYSDEVVDRAIARLNARQKIDRDIKA